MKPSRSAWSWIALALLWGFCARAGAQKIGKPPKTGKPPVIFLSSAAQGKELAASVGQQIEISLAAMSPCEPVVSSHSVRLESIALDWPPTPGLATHVYIFGAANPGEAQVRIPLTDCANPDSSDGLSFAATIRVEPSAGGPYVPYASRAVDQANTSPWTGAWTILLSNDLRQTFLPSRPKLTGVELALVPANRVPRSRSRCSMPGEKYCQLYPKPCR